MYEQIIYEITSSNIGSLIKEHIINSKLVQKNREQNYYYKIHKILSKKYFLPFEKERKLIMFLKKN